MCAGIFLNQEAAVRGQTVISINLILKNLLGNKSLQVNYVCDNIQSYNIIHVCILASKPVLLDNCCLYSLMFIVSLCNGSPF